MSEKRKQCVAAVPFILLQAGQLSLDDALAEALDDEASEDVGLGEDRLVLWSSISLVSKSFAHKSFHNTFAEDSSVSTLTHCSIMSEEEAYSTKTEAFHHSCSLSPAVLRAMCHGVTSLQFDLETEPYCSYPRKSSLRMSRTILANEARRRVREHGVPKAGSPNSHANIPALLTFLLENPITDEEEIAYLQSSVGRLRQNILDIASSSSNGMATSTLQWRGNPCFLRMYHCLLHLRDEFVMRDRALTRQELDDPNRVTFLDRLEALYNSKDFQPRTFARMVLHEDFATSFVLTLEGMPVPTNKNILKRKLSECRYKLLKIINNYEKSGNGDGNEIEDADGNVFKHGACNRIHTHRICFERCASYDECSERRHG